MNNPVNHFPTSYKVLILYILLKTYFITILPFGESIKSVEFYSDVLILCLFFILILNFNKFNNSFSSFSNKSYVPLLIILALFLYSSFYINLEYNLMAKPFFKLIALILIFCAFFLKFGRFLYNNKLLFDRFINYVINISIFLSLSGILFNLFGINTNPILTQAFRGIFMHPNTFAFLFTFSIPCLFYKYYSDQISLLKFIFLLILFLMVLFLTYSRAGFMAALVCMYVFIFFKSRVLSFLLVILFLGIFATFFSEIQGLKSDSTLARGILYITAFNLITENYVNMFWGYGVNRSIDLFTDTKMLFGNFEASVNNPHNFLLLLSLQFGILLAASYFLFIIYILLKSSLKAKLLKDDNSKWKVITCISIVSGLLIQNFFEELIVIPEFPVMPLSLIFLGFLFYFISDKSICDVKLLKD